MRQEPEIQMVNIDDIQVDPAMAPATDERWMALAEQALAGSLPVFHAHIPIGNLIPFDPDYRPDLIGPTKGAIDYYFERAAAGHLKALIVYQRGYWFVVSDDYLPLFSSLQGQPENVPCFVLGAPDHPLLTNITRVRPEDVRTILLGSP